MNSEVQMAEEWTVETLKAYFESKLEGREKAFQAEVDSLKARLNDVNDARIAMASVQLTYMTQAEYTINHNVLAARVETAQQQVNINTARLARVETESAANNARTNQLESQRPQMIMLIMTGIGTLATAATLLFHSYMK
jgi:hypothetical protein